MESLQFSMGSNPDSKHGILSQTCTENVAGFEVWFLSPCMLQFSTKSSSGFIASEQSSMSQTQPDGSASVRKGSKGK